MPEPTEERDEAATRLAADLDAFDASRRRRVRPIAEASGANEGYRLLGSLIGGVVGGMGLGWLADRLAHSSPVGLISGLLIGTGGAIYSIVRSASRMSGPAGDPGEGRGAGEKRDEDGG
jgi:ATP synthase protein I